MTYKTGGQQHYPVRMTGKVRPFSPPKVRLTIRKGVSGWFGRKYPIK